MSGCLRFGLGRRERLFFWTGWRVGRYGHCRRNLPYLCAHGGLRGWRLRWSPPGWSQTEVVCHDMRKKVIPFPPRKAADSQPVTEGHFRITIRVGAQRYTLNIPCQGVALPPEPVLAATKGRLEELQVQTRFLRLCQPAGLGDRIDGWRVHWVGGWKRGMFVVMVERLVGAAQT